MVLKKRLADRWPADSRQGRAARSILTRRCGYLARRLSRRLNRWAIAQNNVRLIQIGSHDGVSKDPFSRHLDAHVDWHAILVEPVPHHFESLKKRRPETRFTLVQAAITDHDGYVDMTVVERTDEMPGWADQINSIDTANVLKHAANIPGLEDALVSVRVPALTFDKLLAQCGIESFDALHIDTEGHDAVVLAGVDLNRFAPKLVMFEHRHLSPAVRKACNTRLTNAGYRLYHSCMDTLALRSG